jgi:hypothetical protein
MRLEEIMNIIEHDLVSAPSSFEAAAKGPVEDSKLCAERMPESWVLMKLMQTAHEHGLAAFPEVLINGDVEYFESDGRSLCSEGFPRSRRC